MKEAIATLAWAAVVYGLIALVRNECVYRVRVAVLNLEPCWIGLALHACLPTYGEMLYSPKYWLLWTQGHWMTWLSRRRIALLPGDAIEKDMP